MFKTITSVLDKNKKPSEEEINKIPSYIFCRWLSSNPNTILAANQFNLYYDIPVVNQYQVIKSAFAGKIKFIPYPKNIAEDKNINVQHLMNFFKISEREARDYLEFISEEELNKIVKIYKDK